MNKCILYLIVFLAVILVIGVVDAARTRVAETYINGSTYLNGTNIFQNDSRVIDESSSSGWDKSRADDFHINGSKNISGNISVDANITYRVGSPLYWLFQAYIQTAIATNVYANTYYEGGTALSSLYCQLTGCTITGNVVIGGNATIDGFLYSRNLNGSSGSGIIEAGAFSTLANLNITVDSERNLTYPAFTVRLQKTDGSVKYCMFAGTTLTVPNNQHTVFYVDNNCVLQNTTVATFLATALSPGGVADVWNVMAHDDDIEVYQGTLLMSRNDIKTRKLSFYTDHLQVVSGIGITTGTFPSLVQEAGTYVYVQDIVTSTEQNTTLVGMNNVYYDGSNWQEDNNTGINITYCRNGTNLILCPSNRYRRYLLFTLGFNDQEDETRLYQLSPTTTEDSWAAVGQCLDITANPISYTLPTFYDEVAVVHHIYCGQRDSAAWTTNFIDLRIGGVGFGATQDTSIFLTKDGTRPLTANWNAGSFNITVEEFLAESWTNVSIVESQISDLDSSNWDKIETDDYYLNGSRNMTGNITFANNITNTIGDQNWWLFSAFIKTLYTTIGNFGTVIVKTIEAASDTITFGDEITMQADINLSGNTLKDGFVNVTSLKTSADQWCNGTVCFTLAQLRNKYNTTSDMQAVAVGGHLTGTVGNAVVVNTGGLNASNITSGEFNDSLVSDDITVDASGKNVTTDSAIVSDADGQGYYDGANQEFHDYWNGTCKVYFIQGTLVMSICP